MKKTAVLWMAGILSLALCACGADGSTSALKDSSEKYEQTTPQVSEQDAANSAEDSAAPTLEDSETRTAEPDSLSDEKSLDETLAEITQSEQETENAQESENVQEMEVTEETSTESALVSETNVTSDGAIDATDLFTDRDLRQTADTADAQTITLADGQNINITEEGVYVLSGTASEVTVTVEVTDDEKVQLVLDGVQVTNTDSPFIYVKNADKVFVTTTSSENSITVSGTFAADGTTNTDAVIFSKDDLVLNGTGSLSIFSSNNGISCKDDLKITGGNLTIDSAADALEANESIAISGGNIVISTRKDALHAENDEDNTTGYIYICGGTLNITASDDGIHGTTIAQIDGGEINITASEGIEATWVQINGGNITVSASDDGINASYKSESYAPVIEINGGYTTVVMGAGDTDGLDSNGSLYINGGTVDITAQSPFDCDGAAEYNGGTMIVNGQETTSISNQMMGGGPGGMGGPQGSGWGDDSGWGGNAGPGGGHGGNPGGGWNF